MPSDPSTSPAEFDLDRSGVKDDSPKTIVATTESLETLAFTGKLIRSVSVFCGLGSLGYLFSTLMGFYYLGSLTDWTWLHTIQVYRLLFFPTMAALGFFGWKYANAINQLSRTQNRDLEKLSNAQSYFWLVVVLHIFIIICGIGLSFSASYAYSAG